MQGSLDEPRNTEEIKFKKALIHVHAQVLLHPPPPTHTPAPSHHDMCLLLSPLRHAAKVVAGQQVDVVEPSISQALQVRQAV